MDKYKKSNVITINLKHQSGTRYHKIFKIYHKKHETVNHNLLIRIYVNKIASTITFETKTGYYLELLKPETMNYSKALNAK